MRKELQSSSVYGSVSHMTLFQELLALFGKERSATKNPQLTQLLRVLLRVKNIKKPRPANPTSPPNKQINKCSKPKTVVLIITMSET